MTKTGPRRVLIWFGVALISPRMAGLGPTGRKRDARAGLRLAARRREGERPGWTAPGRLGAHDLVALSGKPQRRRITCLKDARKQACGPAASCPGPARTSEPDTRSEATISALLGKLEDRDRTLRLADPLLPVLEALGAGVGVFDANGRLNICNGLYFRLLCLEAGFSPEGEDAATIGQHAQAFGETRLRRTQACLRYHDLAPGKTFQVFTSEGQAIQISRQAASLGGFVDTVIAAGAEAQTGPALDELTGLGLRSALAGRLEEAIALTGRGELGALMILDLDRFKAINDTHGHSLGDLVLAEAGRRLKAALRPGDVAVRWGGDEFVVLQRRVRAAREAMDMATRLLAELGRPYEVGRLTLSLSASAGVALIDTPDEPAHVLLDHADLALYQAKAAGRGVTRFFDPALETRLAQRRRLEMELSEAVRAEEFVLHYQPQVDPRTGVICGFEALVRWNHPTRGLLAPQDFMDLAEEAGLAETIGGIVLQSACREAASWRADVGVSVNVSPRQLTGEALYRQVDEALCRSGLAPERLELELPESVFQGSCEAPVAMVRRLRTLGVRIALDNLGRAPGFLRYAGEDLFDSVKLDARRMASAPAPASPGPVQATPAAIDAALAAFCGQIGVSATLSGLESIPGDLGLVAAAFGRMQGHGIARPLPATEAAGLVE